MGASMRSYGQNRRDSNEADIIAEFLARGCSVVQLHTPCDLAVGYRGVSHLVEAKGPRGKLTPAQEQFRDGWRGDFAVVRAPGEVEALVEKWSMA